MSGQSANVPDGGVTGRAALDGILSRVADPGPISPFALLYRPVTDAGQLDLLCGPVHQEESLEALRLLEGEGGQQSLVLVPFRMAALLGLACQDDGAPLLVMPVRARWQLPLAEVVRRLPEMPVALLGGRFDVDDAEYESVVRRVIEEEIGQGEGCNFVISRSFTGTIADYSLAHALAVFRRLLLQEQGAYWTFLVHTGERTFIGATPERHVTLADGVATMNPISGTYRYPPSGPTLRGVLEFLEDGKETDELSMVLDEELKMMGAVCDQGAQVLGPYLKEMTHLAHTEYVIAGRTSLGAAEVIRRTMFAPTVVGSPLVNAFRVVSGHERRGRGHYSGVAALVGRDDRGQDSIDSAIMIRTAEIGASGGVRISVGATLVRHSQPAAEVAETRAKANGLLAAMGHGARSNTGGGLPGGSGVVRGTAPFLAGHPQVRGSLEARNANLNRFWFTAPDARSDDGQGVLAGLRVLVVDAEDRFTTMLAHHIRSLGADTEIRTYLEPVDPEEWDCVVVGPGPGDPLAVGDHRIQRLHAVVRALLGSYTPFLAVCLSHQVLSHQLGLTLRRQDRPSQGEQKEIDLFGSRERVGLYNTFTALSTSDSFVPPGRADEVTVSRESGTGAVHALRGTRFSSFQFHAESVLTQQGRRLLGDTLAALLERAGRGTVLAARRA